MATLPTVPGPFTDGTAPTMTQLQQLSQAVSFISDCTTRPLWHFYKTATATLTANTWKTIGYSQIAYDNDNVASGGGGGAAIVTRGYYAVEACVDADVNSSSFTLVAAFLWTAGSSNPHFTSGTTLLFGARGGNTVSDNSSNTAFCITDICPNVCYAGDTIQVQVWSNNAFVLKYNSNDSWNEGRFVPNFTGLWVCSGT